MPPGLAEPCRLAYEEFVAAHLPSFHDDPLSISARFEGKVSGYGFFDLEPIAQAILAIPFAALTHLQLVDRLPRLTPIERFGRYVEIMADQIGYLSVKELQIARYCFANPPAASLETIRIRRRMRENFVKLKDDSLPRTAEAVLHVAFNGACDLNLLNCADVADGRPQAGVVHECWIATTDGKLAKFSEHVHLLNFGGQSGPIAAVTDHVEHQLDPYWNETRLIWQRALAGRDRIFLPPQPPEELCAVAAKAAEAANAAFPS